MATWREENDWSSTLLPPECEERLNVELDDDVILARDIICQTSLHHQPVWPAVVRNKK